MSAQEAEAGSVRKMYVCGIDQSMSFLPYLTEPALEDLALSLMVKLAAHMESITQKVNKLPERGNVGSARSLFRPRLGSISW